MAKPAKPNPPLEVVLFECALHLGRGVGDHELIQEAFDLWSKHYRETFAEGLKNPKARWNHDKKTVLPLAVKLGKLAAVLAGSNPISRDDAQQASDIVEQDPSCPTEPGAGKYCQ